jgi:hypothetical protein
MLPAFQTIPRSTPDLVSAEATQTPKTTYFSVDASAASGGLAASSESHRRHEWIIWPCLHPDIGLLKYRTPDLISGGKTLQKNNEKHRR